ncbi:MAG: right-handed parallel beta-helix repeat-containing protein [Pirellulales bacterium]
MEVRFAPTSGLVVVDGALSARGTAELPITFVADQPGDVQRWNGIRLGANSADAIYDSEGSFLGGSILEHVDLTGVASHRNGSIRIESTNPFIHASVIHNNLSSAINVIDANGLRIVGNKLEDNVAIFTSDHVFGGGIALDSSADVLISDNEITNNTSQGGSAIYVTRSNEVSITGNFIESNKGNRSRGGKPAKQGVFLWFDCRANELADKRYYFWAYAQDYFLWRS